MRNNNEYEKHDIILQGKYDEFTNDVIESYLNVPFVNKIILSCWDDDDLSSFRDIIDKNVDRIVLVPNKKPTNTGDDNVNLQIFSSFSGIKKSTTEYSIKMRTDQLYDHKSMLNMYEFFIENREKDRIFVPGLYPHLLFHPRDHLFWGKTEDLYKLFDIPLKTYNITDLVKISKNDLWKYYPYFTRSETYIGAHYCSNFDDRVKIMLIQQDKYLYDNCQQWDESHEISTSLLKRLFKSFPKEGIDLKWPKKDLMSYPYDDQKNGYNECWHEDGV